MPHSAKTFTFQKLFKNCQLGDWIFKLPKAPQAIKQYHDKALLKRFYHGISLSTLPQSLKGIMWSYNISIPTLCRFNGYFNWDWGLQNARGLKYLTQSPATLFY